MQRQFFSSFLKNLAKSRVFSEKYGNFANWGKETKRVKIKVSVWYWFFGFIFYFPIHLHVPRVRKSILTVQGIRFFHFYDRLAESHCIRFVTYVRDYLQISLLILSEFRRINWILFSLKSSENMRLCNDF